jgi:hypothetical protein
LLLAKKPYYLLLITGILLLLASVSKFDTTVIDIHLHDTYIVLDFVFIIRMLAILTLILWVLYLVVGKILFSPSLTWVHIIATIVLITVLCSQQITNAGMPRRYVDYETDFMPKAMNTLVLAFLFLALVQLIFIGNLLIGLFKRWKR